MRKLFSQLESILGLIIFLYLIPVIALSMYSMEVFTPNRSWSIASLGLLLGSFGSLIIFILLRGWENTLAIRFRENAQNTATVEPPQAIPHAPPQPSQDGALIDNLQNSLNESQQRHQELFDELNAKHAEIDQLQQTAHLLRKQAEEVLRDFAQYKDTAQEQLQQKEIFLGEYQHTITEQRAVIEKKQQHIATLESKIQDLNYEIKTLLQVGQADAQPLGSILVSPVPPAPITHGIAINETAALYQADVSESIEEETLTLDKMVRTPEEAAIQLKRCLDIAQKITGAAYMVGGSSRFDMPRDNYALDLRRLFDNLRSENASSILVYSQKENKLLFVNNQAKNLLGWSPDKFVQNFQDIVQDGIEEWKNGISELSMKPITHARMLMKTKSGQDILVHCQLAAIPTGIFRNHVIGVLYPA